MLDIAIFLSAIRDGKKSNFKSEIKKEFLLPKYHQALDFTIDHIQKYAEIPTWETIAHENNIDPPEDIDADENLGYYIDKAKKRYVNTELKKVLDGAGPKLNQDPLGCLTGLKDEIIKIQAEISGIDQKGKVFDWSSAEEGAKRASAYLDKKANNGRILGMATPWRSLNEVTQGICSAQLWVFVALAKTGKTWIIVFMAIKCWLEGKKILFISPEVEKESIGERLDTTNFKLSYSRLRGLKLDSDEQIKYLKALTEIEKDNNFMVASNGAVSNIDDVEVLADRFEPDIIFLDSLYMIDPSTRGKKLSQGHEMTTELCKQLQHFIKRKGIPVVATTQFNREADPNGISAGKGQLGYAFNIVQYVDFLIGAYRPPSLVMNNQMVLRMLDSRGSKNVNMLTNFNLDTVDIDEIGTFDGDRLVDLQTIKYTHDRIGDMSQLAPDPPAIEQKPYNQFKQEKPKELEWKKHTK